MPCHAYVCDGIEYDNMSGGVCKLELMLECIFEDKKLVFLRRDPMPEPVVFWVCDNKVE